MTNPPNRLWAVAIQPMPKEALLRQAEDILQQDPLLLPISWEKINDAWDNHVKGHHPYHYCGIYDVLRWDTVWLDQ